MTLSSGATGISDGAQRRPAPLLQPYVRRYEGYRLTGFAPGEHLGLPSPDLTVVLSLGDPVDIARPATPDQSPGRFIAPAGGLTTSSVTIAHDGNQYGIQLALTPAGGRALFGMPTAALGPWVVELEDLFGADYRELVGRVVDASTWPERFDILDRVLARRIASVDGGELDSQLARAWDMVVSGPHRTVREVADELGWSRRHLSARFAAEYGLGPKEAARIARFARSRMLLRRPGAGKIADVAVRCGYYDQAHLAREWRDIAGVPPSRWLEDEVFPFVQDVEVPTGEHSKP
ncbi:AraC family transcriptional regulator [Rhodococcus chondri]|uniref:AraC family transcriptional regulator n=1 Tax=Rhodococcus chondri TaxID=3065941 RepID=A0ABU7JYC8_9NOCA|nr:AraC family transcriptional regulator [Rhodococcus sp. CC-R104]MEE2035011.1 AraC family transcriptional regulator [Rhodococcus sp. CC-R104]